MVIFLQNLSELYGSSVVLEGVVIGCLFTAAAGVLTFGLHQRLPYKRLLIITGVMLLFVLLVSVGEEVNEMQLAGWIGTTPVHGLSIPGWMGTWFSLFANWETFAGQAIALVLVLGSYFAAQYLRVWRPRRRGQRAAVRATRPPAGASPSQPLAATGLESPDFDGLFALLPSDVEGEDDFSPEPDFPVEDFSPGRTSRRRTSRWRTSHRRSSRPRQRSRADDCACRSRCCRSLCP